MDIIYEGPPWRVGAIAQQLEAYGIIVRHGASEERRSIGADVAVVILLKVVNHVADDVIDVALTKVKEKLAARLPGIKLYRETDT